VAHWSKVVKPNSFILFGRMYFLKEYISTIEFDIGVPDKGCAFV
jgi:hypothetical protein